MSNLGYSTVRRYLKAHAMHRQRRPSRTTEGAQLARDRLEQLEVRSFELEHVCALWHLDFHHASRRVLTRAGHWVRPILLGVIDDRSRVVCHLQWYLDESAQSLVHGLSQAFMKRGLPRALMSDNGAAMLSQEFTSGLARLGIVHQTTLPYSPYQNAKQESFWGRVEGRLMPMLEGETAQVRAQCTQASPVSRARPRGPLQGAPGQWPGPSPGTSSPLDCLCPGSAAVCVFHAIPDTVPL